MLSSTVQTGALRIAAACMASMALVTLAACDYGNDGIDTNARRPTNVVTELKAGDEVSVAKIASILATAEEVVDTARVTMDIVDGGQAVSAEGVFQKDPQIGKLTLSIMEMDLSLRFFDDEVFVLFPAPGVGLQWLSVGPESIDELGLGGVGDLLMDVGQQFELIADAVASVTFEGRDTIDRVESDHYAMKLHSERAAEAFDVDPGVLAGQEWTQDIWIDASGRLMKVSSAIGDLSTTTVTYVDYGVQVDVKAPPRDEVEDFTDFMAKLGNPPLTS